MHRWYPASPADPARLTIIRPMPAAGTPYPPFTTLRTRPTFPSPPTYRYRGVASGDPEELLNEADALFAAADDALADGDLGLYQQNIDAARDLIADAVEILINQS